MFSQPSPFGGEQVGQTYANGILLPTNQWIKPAGTRALVVDNGRMLSSAISPNGEFLAGLTWDDFAGFLTVVNLKTGKIRPAGRHRRRHGQDRRRRHGSRRRAAVVGRRQDGVAAADC